MEPADQAVDRDVREAANDDPGAEPFAPLIARVTAIPATAEDTEDQYEAAEVLHTLGTAEALRRLDAVPRHAYARALLRDAASGIRTASSSAMACA